MEKENILYEKMEEDIYRILVPLPNNPLRATNAYLIRGEKRDLLIDTGFRREECREALNRSLEALKVDRNRLDVAITHIHSDHLGLADEMAGSDCTIYMSRADVQYLEKLLSGRHSSEMHRMIAEGGYPPETLAKVEKGLPSKVYSMNTMDKRIHPLEDGECFGPESCRLKLLLMPGHSPGNSMFWAKERGIMFTGDHILFDISPNITVFADMEDSLGAYLNSLRNSMKYPVRLALPGHRMPGDYHKRIGELIYHHQERLKELLKVLKEHPGSSAYEIASYMSWHIHGNGWEDFPDRQKWYAVGETLAHLEYLIRRGMAVREENENKTSGRYYLS